MIDFLVTATCIIQVIILILAVSNLKRFLLDISGLLSLLFLVFYCFPAWDFIYGWELVNHEYAPIYGVFADREYDIKMLLSASFVFLCFLLGYRLKVNFGKKTYQFSVRENKYYYKMSGKNYIIIQFALLTCIMAVLLHEYIIYGGNIISFLLPSRKTIVKSEIEDTIQYIFPLIMFNLAIIKYENNKKRFLKLVPFYLICALTASVGAQRRDMIATLIFILMLSMSKNLIELNSKAKVIWGTSKIRHNIIRVGILAIVCVPLFWYARNFSSQLSRGDSIIKPWELRGFTELIFGSSSSGFETLLILDKYKDVLNIPFGHTFLFIISMFIPRSLWDGKPMTIPMMLKTYTGQQGNLSLFLVNDLLLSFSILAPIFALIFGAVLRKLYSNIRSTDIFAFSKGVFILASIVLLFKNGIGQFAFDLIFYCVIMRIIKIFSRMENYE